MENRFKNCCDYSFKTKETRDSNNSSNESQRGTNFLRDSFRRNQPSQDASPSHHSKDANLSLLPAIADLQRQMASSSYHPERLFEKVNPTVLGNGQEENDKPSKPEANLKRPAESSEPEENQSKRARFADSETNTFQTASETSDHSSVHSSPTDSRRLETSLSHDTELADRLQRLLAERQRQEISSADFRPSQQKVRLKNGSEVLAGDIPPIMNSLRKMKKQHQEIMEEMKITSFLAAYGITDAYRENSNQNRVGRMVDLELALYDLEQKCSNPNYQLSSNSQKVL